MTGSRFPVGNKRYYFCTMNEQVNSFPDIRIRLPGWVDAALPSSNHVFRTDEEKMRLAVMLARENVRHDTGGPFGAAIFDSETGRLVAPGVNIVVSSYWSGGHAEMVAFALAQQMLKTHDLGGAGMPFCELFTSVEPCAMCLGGTLWSGVRRLVCGARDADARRVGFDEGPKPAEWEAELEKRDIRVTRDLLRDEAAGVLEEYLKLGKPIYNARQQQNKG